MKPEPNNEFSKEQEQAIADVYQYSDSGNYTEEDLKLAAVMFDTPEKFKLLRKILGVLTTEEKGLTMPSSQSLVQASITDLQGYAVETAVNHLAQEKIRKGLFGFYRVVRNHIVEEKKAAFRKLNQESFEEGKRSEAHAAEEAAAKDLGPHL